MTSKERRNHFQCHACDSHNITADSSWCRCETSAPTLVCAGCKACFCNAPGSWQREFWRQAAGSVLESQRKEMRSRRLGISTEEHPGERPIVLFIDDDRVMHAIVSRVLADFPGTILHAYDGNEGFAMARSTRPDLVVADALIPGIDGRILARALKSDPSMAPMRVVLMTGLYKGVSHRNEAFRDYLIDDFVAKPASPEKLLELVDRMVGAQRSPILALRPSAGVARTASAA